jgi:uncharacterized protein (DUF2249 family)
MDAPGAFSGARACCDQCRAALYYQFAAELSGQFDWEYREQGPEVWRVRIKKTE